MRPLVTGKPSIARVYCSRCREETLHHFRRCNHCGKERPNSVSWEEDFYARVLRQQPSGPKGIEVSNRAVAKRTQWLRRGNA